MMTNEEYHSTNGISKSMLDKIHISPLAYWDAYINPDMDARESTPAMLFGSAAHTGILETDKFWNEYYIEFDKNKFPDALDTLPELRSYLKDMGMPSSGTKPELIERILLSNSEADALILSCIEKKYDEENLGKKIISQKDVDALLGMSIAIDSHHSAFKLLDGAKIEESFFVKDEFGLVRKCRPDIITKNGRVVCDLKTTNDVSSDSFPMSFYKYRYHVQAAWYLDTLKLYLGDDAPDTFCFLAVQKKRPYDVAVYVVPEEVINLGRVEYQKDYALLRKCLESNVWPGADGGELLQMSLPKWASYSNIDE